MSKYVIPAGWHRKTTNTVAAFRKAHGREPDAGELGRLAYVVKFTVKGLKRGNEATYELGHEMLRYFLKHLRLAPKAMVNAGGPLHAKAIATVQAHKQAWADAHPSIFKKLSPARLIAAAANVVSSALPFVKTALSLIPGVGTGINMALSAAESLAKGRPITDAFADAALAALPGGPVAQTAARTALSLAKGERIDRALLESAKANLPPVARKAFDTGLAIAQGRNLQDVAIEQVKNLAADQLKGLKLPIPPGVNVPKLEQGGFKIAVGVLNRTKLPDGTPLTPAAALAIRERLKPHARAGFDRALRMRALRNARAGSMHVPVPARPQPSFKGATFVTREGVSRIGEVWTL